MRGCGGGDNRGLPQAACVEGIILFSLIGQSPPNFLPQLVLNFLPFW